MRTMIAQDAKVLATGTRADWLLFEVKDSEGNWRDLTAYLVEPPSYGQDDVDTPITQARISFWRNEGYVSLAANMAGSRLNKNSLGSYAPLLELNRDVRLRGRVWPSGWKPAAADYQELWRGRIEDVDDYSSPDTISLTCHDQAARIQASQIEDEATYGSDAGVALETVIQQIWDSGSLGYTLWCPVSPSYAITPAYTQSETSRLDATMTLIALRGWAFSFNAWDEGTGAFRPKLFDPNRSASTSLYTFGRTVYTPTKFARALANIRNVVKVSYPDEASGERRTVTVSDAASILKYGRLYGKIVEPDNSPIKSLSAATTLRTRRSRT